ncbi:MAG: TetR/AcrR family transcriptional regulator [Lachnospiraceae bacterium]|nr:TetR/AcrR family transcriptional regulator [Lachnospiraceae bacterium]
MNNQDLRVIKTRKNISDQLIEELKTHGFHEISVKMLIADSQINRSTFYRNYEDKYALLDSILQELLADFDRSLDASFVLMSYQDADAYHPKLKKMIRFFDKNREYLTVLWKAALPVNFYDVMTERVEEGLLTVLMENYEVPEKDRELLELYACLFAAQTMATMRWWLNSDSRMDESALLEILTQNVEKGLFRTMKTISLYRKK